MSSVNITDTIKYIGVADKTLDLFESQYVIPRGVTYNSYLILDEKIAVMDTVDKRGTAEWLQKLDAELAGRTPDYLIIQHMEPDHSGSIKALTDRFPDMQLVASAKAFAMLDAFLEDAPKNPRLTVGEGDKLELGSHTLNFVLAPMVHWPEVMVTYESSEKILFSADGFGTFGTLDQQEDDWSCEARRYFINIVGRYGPSVQMLLKKAAKLDIAQICPLHGPVLAENLGYYIEKYDIWSSYRPEDKGIVIAYNSVHGNTARAVKELAALLEQKGAPAVSLFDLARDDMAEAIEDAYRYDRLVLAASTYDASLFPPMQDFLYHLQIKNFQSRTVGIIENGSWGPMAARKMQEMLEKCKNITLLEPVVTIKSALNEASRAKLAELAEAIADA